METNRTGEMNLGSGLFIHKTELNHFQRFLVNKIKSKSDLLDSYGVIDLANAGYTLSIVLGKVSIDGDLSMIGMDINKDLIFLDRKKELTLPTAAPNTQYKLGITRATTNVEIGTVNISTTGSIVGTDTLFTKVLRDNSIAGKASKIKFQSTLNTGEYTVQSIVDDTHIVISGTLLAEEGVTYSVVGTFSADTNVEETDKYPLLYDSYSLSWLDIEDDFNETTSFQIGVLSYNGSSVPSIEISIKTNFLERLAEKTNSSGVNLPVKAYFKDNTDRDERYEDFSLESGMRFLIGNITTVNPDGTDFSSYKDQIVEWDGQSWRGLYTPKITSMTFIEEKDTFYKKTAQYIYSEYYSYIKQQYFQGIASLTTVPPTTYCSMYKVHTAGTYVNFLDINGDAIEVVNSDYNENNDCFLASSLNEGELVWSKITVPMSTMGGISKKVFELGVWHWEDWVTRGKEVDLSSLIDKTIISMNCLIYADQEVNVSGWIIDSANPIYIQHYTETNKLPSVGAEIRYSRVVNTGGTDLCQVMIFLNGDINDTYLPYFCKLRANYASTTQNRGYLVVEYID